MRKKEIFIVLQSYIKYGLLFGLVGILFGSLLNNNILVFASGFFSFGLCFIIFKTSKAISFGLPRVVTGLEAKIHGLFFLALGLIIILTL